MPTTQRLLELALKGIEAERAKIDDEIAQIQSQLNHRSTTAPAANPAPAMKRTMSVAARRKISEGMKRMYAEVNKAAGNAGPKQISAMKQNGGDRLTAAGRKTLSDLMKKRWAERRKAKAR